MYVNRETGQRTHEFPQGGYGQESRGYGGGMQGGYGGMQQGYGQQGGYGGQQGYSGQQSYQEPVRQSHSGRNMALGAVAGVAGGALLMHEGEKVGT